MGNAKSKIESCDAVDERRKPIFCCAVDHHSPVRSLGTDEVQAIGQSSRSTNSNQAPSVGKTGSRSGQPTVGRPSNLAQSSEGICSSKRPSRMATPETVCTLRVKITEAVHPRDTIRFVPLSPLVPVCGPTESPGPAAPPAPLSAMSLSSPSNTFSQYINISKRMDLHILTFLCAHDLGALYLSSRGSASLVHQYLSNTDTVNLCHTELSLLPLPRQLHCSSTSAFTPLLGLRLACHFTKKVRRLGVCFTCDYPLPSDTVINIEGGRPYVHNLIMTLISANSAHLCELKFPDLMATYINEQVLGALAGCPKLRALPPISSDCSREKVDQCISRIVRKCPRLSSLVFSVEKEAEEAEAIKVPVKDNGGRGRSKSKSKTKSKGKPKRRSQFHFNLPSREKRVAESDSDSDYMSDDDDDDGYDEVEIDSDNANEIEAFVDLTIKAEKARRESMEQQQQQQVQEDASQRQSRIKGLRIQTGEESDDSNIGSIESVSESIAESSSSSESETRGQERAVVRERQHRLSLSENMAAEVLSAGLPLSNIRMSGPSTPRLVSLLSSPSHRRLKSLTLTLNDRASYAAFVTRLNSGTWPKLEALDITLGAGLGHEVLLPSMWDMPSVASVKLSADPALTWLPTFHAPCLTTLHVHASALAAWLPMLKSCPNVKHLEMNMDLVQARSSSQLQSTLESFAKDIQNGFGGQLVHFACSIPLSKEVLLAMSQHWRLLTALAVFTANVPCKTICDVLSLPALQTAAISGDSEAKEAVGVSNQPNLPLQDDHRRASASGPSRKGSDGDFVPAFVCDRPSRHAVRGSILNLSVLEEDECLDDEDCPDLFDSPCVVTSPVQSLELSHQSLFLFDNLSCPELLSLSLSHCTGQRGLPSILSSTPKLRTLFIEGQVSLFPCINTGARGSELIAWNVSQLNSRAGSTRSSLMSSSPSRSQRDSLMSISTQSRPSISQYRASRSSLSGSFDVQFTNLPPPLHIHSLSHLTLYQCPLLSDSTLPLLSRLMPNLQELHVHGCDKLTDQCLTQLARAPFPQLQRCVFSMCPRSYVNEHVREFLVAHPQLNQLSLPTAVSQQVDLDLVFREKKAAPSKPQPMTPCSAVRFGRENLIALRCVLQPVLNRGVKVVVGESEL